MGVESAEDRLAFFDADEFGALATYRCAGGAEASGITGMFDDPSLTLEIGEHAPSVERRTSFTCRSADLPAEAAGGDAGDEIEIDGATFRVLDLLPDGTGLTHITLGAAA